MKGKRERFAKAVNTHVHLRTFGPDGIGTRFLKHHDAWCTDVVAIGNVPPLLTASDALRYQENIQRVSEEQKLKVRVHLAPMLSSGYTTESMVHALAKETAARGVGWKFMARGASTSSHDSGRMIGVDLSDLEFLSPVFGAMQETDQVLLIHAEVPAHPKLHDRERETECIPMLWNLHKRYPRLRMSIEHVSTEGLLGAGYELWDSSEGRIMCGIAPQHLRHTWSDVLTNVLRTANLCRPPMKVEADRIALCEAVFGGAKHVMAGTDCAPHEPNAKHADDVPCGIANAPVAAAVYAELCAAFGGNWRILEAFFQRGRAYYGLLEPDKDDWFEVTCDKDNPVQIPAAIDGIRTMMAEQNMAWRLVPRT